MSVWIVEEKYPILKHHMGVRRGDKKRGCVTLPKWEIRGCGVLGFI